MYNTQFLHFHFVISALTENNIPCTVQSGQNQPPQLEMKKTAQMKKKIFDVIVIVSATALLILLSESDLLEKAAPFMLVPILGFYFLGQYSERRFKK